MVSERSAATAAENKPAYSGPVYAQDNVNGDSVTHENKDPISIFLPAFDHLVVFIVRSLGIYGEERPRTVSKVGISLRWLLRCPLRVVEVGVCHRYL